VSAERPAPPHASRPGPRCRSGAFVALALFGTGCASLLGVDDVSRQDEGGAAGDAGSGPAAGAKGGGTAGVGPGGQGGVGPGGGGPTGGRAGAAGGGPAGAAGAGGLPLGNPFCPEPQPPVGEAFVRFANLVPFSESSIDFFRFCYRDSTTPLGSWRGPFPDEGSLGFLSTHGYLKLEGGAYDLRVTALDDCDFDERPEFTVDGCSLGASAYTTFAVVAGGDQIPRLVGYPDAPIDGLLFATALAHAGGAVDLVSFDFSALGYDNAELSPLQHGRTSAYFNDIAAIKIFIGSQERFADDSVSPSFNEFFSPFGSGASFFVLTPDESIDFPGLFFGCRNGPFDLSDCTFWDILP
jgi:hypothetical protein